MFVEDIERLEAVKMRLQKLIEQVENWDEIEFLTDELKSVIAELDGMTKSNG